MSRYHKIDGWRGYRMPQFAVMGASDTGMAPDSPARTDVAKAEIELFRKDCLRPAGIKSRIDFGPSSNVFCGKRWVTVHSRDFDRAAQLATDWDEKNKRSTQLIHTADLETLGYKSAVAP